MKMLYSEYGPCTVPTGTLQVTERRFCRASGGPWGITVGWSCWTPAGLLLRVGDVPKAWHRHALKCDFIPGIGDEEVGPQAQQQPREPQEGRTGVSLGLAEGL